MPISFVCFLSLRVCKWWECSLNYIKKVYIKNKKSQVTIYFAMLPTTFEKSSFLSLKTFIFSIFVFLLVANNFSTHFVLFVGNSGSNMLCNCWWIFYYFILFFLNIMYFLIHFHFQQNWSFLFCQSFYWRGIECRHQDCGHVANAWRKKCFIVQIHIEYYIHGY